MPARGMDVTKPYVCIEPPWAEQNRFSKILLPICKLAETIPDNMSTYSGHESPATSDGSLPENSFPNRKNSWTQGLKKSKGNSRPSRRVMANQLLCGVNVQDRLEVSRTVTVRIYKAGLLKLNTDSQILPHLCGYIVFAMK